MTNSSCLLLDLPEDVQAQIVVALHAVGIDCNLRGAQSLLSLRLASKRAASFGLRGCPAIALEFVLVGGHTVQLLVELKVTIELWLSALALDEWERPEPTPARIHAFLEFSPTHFFCAVLAHAEAVQAAIARHRMLRREEYSRIARRSGGKVAEMCAGCLDEVQDQAAFVAAAPHQLTEAFQEARAELLALLPRPVQPRAEQPRPVRPVPEHPAAVRRKRSGLRRLFCLGMLDAV